MRMYTNKLYLYVKRGINMLFLGDFVFPFNNKEKIYDFNQEFIEESKVVNLESLVLAPDKYKKLTSGIALHSSAHVYSILKDLNVKTVGLANNHITDYNYDIVRLKNDLNQNGISSVGAGKDLEDAIRPSFIEDKNFKYIIFSFGWNVIGCKYASKNNPGVAPLNEGLIIDMITETKNKYPDHKIILFLHWNYEFEYYPQPADRKLAFSAIDAGVDMIIGHHPHIVGVYESYKNKPIFYSLGNFFIPEYHFGDFILKYGKLAQTGLGVKYSEDLGKITLYWLKNISNKLTIEMIESLQNSKRLEDFSNHYQDDLIAYTKWFNMHRKKKKLLPVYQEHSSSLKNSMIYLLLSIRNYIVHKITSLGLRKRNS